MEFYIDGLFGTLRSLGWTDLTRPLILTRYFFPSSEILKFSFVLCFFIHVFDNNNVSIIKQRFLLPGND